MDTPDTTPYPSDQSAELDRELTPLTNQDPAIGSDLKATLGLGPDDDLFGNLFVVAFHLMRTEEQLNVRIATPATFIHHERSPQGDYLTVVLPLERITRVSTLKKGGEPVVTVEYDADQLTTNGEMFTFPSGDESHPPGSALSRTRSVAQKAAYLLRGDGAVKFAGRLSQVL